jgi:uroporphyrinogen-III synthase
MSSPERAAILITRPSPGAEETASRVAGLGLRPVVAPMLSIRALPIGRLPKRIDAVLLTSRNGLLGLPPSLHATPLFAVGAATAAAARAHGFATVHSADADGAALRALVRGSMAGPRPVLLLPTARGQGAALAAGLRADGFAVHRRAVYEARPAQSLPAGARAALVDGLRAALFFSAETARAFVVAVRRAGLIDATRDVDACAIGAAAGVALGTLPWRRVRVAARPTQDDLLALLR